MEFTIQSVITALAEAVKAVLPDVTVYANPNQQGTALPAVFISFMETSIEKQMDTRFLRRLGVDLAYLEELNCPDLHDRYLAAAEALDRTMETISFADGRSVRTYDRKWFTELDALHYQLKIKARVLVPTVVSPIRTIERITQEVII